MSDYLQQMQRRRTFAIISHPDAGKTTLTEKLLLFGGAIQMAGTVKGRKAARHATSDWMEMEKQRGISVTSSVMQFPYADAMVNLLDTPGHEDAVSVELVWVSSGSLADVKGGGEKDESGSGGYARPGETAEERAEREQAEAYYCKRATEIFESYLNAPRLYRTNDAGERVYLDKEEGRLATALARYNGSAGSRVYSDKVEAAWRHHWKMAPLDWR